MLDPQCLIKRLGYREDRICRLQRGQVIEAPPLHLGHSVSIFRQATLRLVILSSVDIAPGVYAPLNLSVTVTGQKFGSIPGRVP